MRDASTKPLNPGKVKFIIGSFISLLVLAAALYGIKPNYLKYAELRQSNRAVQDFVANVPKYNADIESHYKKLADLKIKLLEGQGGVSHKQMESYVVKLLQSTAWTQDVDLHMVNPKTKRRVVDFDELQFEVAVSGTYFNLYAWLQEVYNKMDFIVVEQSSIQTSTESKNPALLEMKISLIVYTGANS